MSKIMNKIINIINNIFDLKEYIYNMQQISGTIMEKVMINMEELNFTDIGYGYKLFPVFDPNTGEWVEPVKVRGIFALLPVDGIFFVRVYKVHDKNGKSNKFDFEKWYELARRAIQKGSRPLPWKDTGIKDSKGEWRLLPFARNGFDFNEWLKKMNIHIPEEAFAEKGAKFTKYMTQPVDFRRREVIRILVIPAEILNADGCGYTEKPLFGIKGKEIVKGMGLGKNEKGEGIVYKGIIKTNMKYNENIPEDVLKEIKKRFSEDEFDVIATTDTVKFSKPWNIYTVELFWHDDSTRNVHSTVLLSEQILRNAGELSKEYRDRIDAILKAREEELDYILGLEPKLRGIALALWINPILKEANLEAGENNGDELVIGDIAKLLSLGLPINWAPGRRGNSLLNKIKRGIISFIRRRAIGSIKVGGTLGFAIANSNIERGTILIPRKWAKMNNVKIGDIVTAIKSPVCARSIMTFKVAGFVDGNWVEKHPADAFNHDFDGDKVMVIKGSLSANPDHYRVNRNMLKKFEKELEEIIEDSRVDINVPDAANKDEEYINTLWKAFATLDQSNGVGMFSYHRGIWETTGKGSADEIIKVKTSLAFQMIEEGALIKAKKHSAKAIDLGKLIENVEKWVHPEGINNRQLARIALTSKNQTEDRVRMRLNGVIWNKKEHKEVFIGNGIEEMIAAGLPMGEIYGKGTEIAKKILDAFDNDNYADMYRKFKKDWFRYWRTVIDWARKNDVEAAKYFKGVNATGELANMIKESRMFWRTAMTTKTTEEKEAFREKEKEWFAKFDPISRRVFLIWIINQELYSWIYHFKPEEILRVMIKSGWITMNNVEKINADMKRIMEKKSMLRNGEDVEIVEAISTILDGIINNVKNNDDPDDDPDPDNDPNNDGPDNDDNNGNNNENNVTEEEDISDNENASDVNENRNAPDDSELTFDEIIEKDGSMLTDDDIKNNTTEEDRRNIVANNEDRTLRLNDGRVITLNDQQIKAIRKIIDWINNSTYPFFTLSGYAGTGKTTTMKKVLEIIGDDFNIAVAAPTHQAKKVIMSATGFQGYTVQALLGLRPDFNLENLTKDKLNFVMDHSRTPIMSEYNMIIVDEASMINAGTFEMIKKLAKMFGTRIIFLGDSAQLPPVNEDISPVFTKVPGGCRAHLDKVERTADGNPLFEIFGAIRNNINAERDMFAHITKRNSKGEGVVFTNNEDEFIDMIKKAFTSNKYRNNRKYAVVLAYTNAATKKWNSIIRTIIKGKNAGYIEEGDVIVGMDTISSESRREILVENSRQYIVTNVNPIVFGPEDNMKGWRIDIVPADSPRSEENTIEIVNMRDPETRNIYIRTLKELYNQAINADKFDRSFAWKLFFEFQQRHISMEDVEINGRIQRRKIDFGYAITVHKSQGSEYDIVFIDLPDINKDRKNRERNQLKYVAFSRAKKIAAVLDDDIRNNDGDDINNNGEYRVIIAGSRTFNNYEMLRDNLDKILANKMKTHRVIIISGGARGADTLGERYAKERNIGLEVYPAKWDVYGRSAGYRRNEEMAEVADALIAFWDGKSHGTKHMIELMNSMNKPVRVVRFDGSNQIAIVTNNVTNSDEGNTDEYEDKVIELYVDGSWSSNNPNVAGWGVCSEDGKVKLHGKVDNPEAVKMHQVVGEMKAAIEAVDYAIKNGYDKVIIKHDYLGVAKWVEGGWKTKTELTKKYAEWMRSQNIEIEFEKVDAADNPADELARKETGGKYAH